MAQAAEALAMLVALRLWSSWWLDQRVCLAVQTDNVACLSMVCKMQPHSEQLGLIAREIALDVAQSSYSPDEAVHIPGIANKSADFLSRLHMPNAPQPPRFPPCLPSHLSTPCEPRERGWWRSLGPS